MTEKIGLEAVLENDQFETGLAQYLTGIDQMIDGAEEMKSASVNLATGTETVGDSFLSTGEDALTFAANMETLERAMGAVQEVAGEALDMAELGAQFERVERRFVSFASEVGDAEEIFEAFQEGAGGAADKMGAMQSAGRLLQMGLVEDAEQMRTLVEMATRLGDQTQSVTDRVSDFSLMLANSSVPRLDNFGISSGVARARIEELMASVEGMTREQAFMQATMEEGAKSLEVLGERVDDDAAAFERAKAKMTDARIEMGQKLAPVMGTLTGIVGDLDSGLIGTVTTLGTFGRSLPGLISAARGLGSVMGSVAGGAANLAASLGTTTMRMGALWLAIGVLVIAYGELKKKQQEVNEAAVVANEAAAQSGQKWEELMGRGVSLTGTLKAVADESNKVSDAWNSNAVTGTALGGVFGTNVKWLELTAERQAAVQTLIIENTSGYNEYLAAVDHYNANVEDSALKLEVVTVAQFEQAKALEETQEATEDVTTAVEEKTRAISNDADETDRAAQTEKLFRDEVLESGQAQGDYAEQVEGSTFALEGYELAQITARQEANRHSAEILGQEERLAELDAAAESTKARLQELADKQLAAEDAARRHTVALLDQAERMSDAEPAAVASAAISDLKTKLDAGIISQGQYEVSVRQVQDTFELVTPQGRATAEMMADLSEAMDRGIIPADKYDDALQFIIDSTEDGETSTQEMLDTFGNVPVTVDPATGAILRMKDATDETVGAFEDGEEAAEDYAGGLRDTHGAIEETGEKMEGLAGVAQAQAGAFRDAGASMAENLIRGFTGGMGVLEDEIRAALGTIREHIPSSRPKDRSSPLYDLQEGGEAIITQLSLGVYRGLPEASEAGAAIGEALIVALEESLSGGKPLLEELFAVGDILGGVGGFAADLLEERMIDPLEDQLDSLDDVIEDTQDKIDEINQRRKDIIEELGGAARLPRLLLLREISPRHLTKEQLRLLDEFVGLDSQRGKFAREQAVLEEERAAAAAAYAEQQERILELQEKQMQLKFLEEQLALLDLIREHGLDADAILGGLTLGLDADLPALIDAMTAAMREVIERAEQELQISSPSAVFEQIGRDTMRGMAMGIEDMMNLPVRQSAIAARQVMSMPVVGAGGSMTTDNRRFADVSAPVTNTFNTQMDSRLVQSHVERGIERALRGM